MAILATLLIGIAQNTLRNTYGPSLKGDKPLRSVIRKRLEISLPGRIRQTGNVRDAVALGVTEQLKDLGFSVEKAKGPIMDRLRGRVKEIPTEKKLPPEKLWEFGQFLTEFTQEGERKGLLGRAYELREEQRKQRKSGGGLLGFGLFK